MNRIFETLAGSGAERGQRKKIAMMAIYVTLALIVCMLIVLGVSLIASSSDVDEQKKGDGMTYVGLSVENKAVHTGSLLLVNKNNEYSFADNPELVSFSTSRVYGLKDNTLKLSPTALSAFDLMMSDLYKSVQDADIVVMTAFRSKEYQDSLSNGTPGGFSDFHTGMSFELKDGDTYDGAYDNVDSLPKYDWLYKNAHKYGFIVRYPNDTAEKEFSAITGVDDYGYVFRYVGVAHASYIYEHDLCLEEYLELLRTSHKHGSSLSIKAGNSQNYEVYYCESTGDKTEIQVPTQYSYEISGDNMNGYIVTVCKSKSAN